MKKNFFILFGITNLCFSQDVITLKTGEEIKSKVLEVGITEIRYKKSESQDTTTFILNKNDIQKIKYKSGRVDAFNESNTDVIVLKTGEEIKSKVLEVGITEIQYKKTGTEDTIVVYRAKKADVFMIKYKGGRKDVFNETMPAELNNTDIITLKTGEEIKSKVLEIGITQIQYRKANDPDTEVFFVSKSEVFMIKYKNGKIETFNEAREEKSSKYTYEQGMKDAEKHYPVMNTGAGGVAAATIGCGVFGLIPAAICAGTTPNDKNLGITDRNLLNNQSYMAGYRIQAHKMKRAKIWRTFGISFAIAIVLVVVLSTQ